MRDVLRGLEMCDKHIYKMTRWNNGKGGASKIGNGIIINEIMALVTHKIHNYAPLLPPKFSDVKPRDVWIPHDMWKHMGQISSYLNFHANAAPVAITLLDGIVDMQRFGIHELKAYRKFIERLDFAPPGTFHDFVQICMEYEKEMER